MKYSKESFELWLSEIPQKMKTFTNDFAKTNKLKLDLSLESLDALEKWILKNYDVAADLKDDDDILDLLAIYVGETYMKYIGGSWFVNLEDEKNVFYGHILMKYIDEEGDVAYRSAVGLCTSSISRKKGDLLSRTLRKSLTKEMQ